MTEAKSIAQTLAELTDVFAALEPRINPQLRPAATEQDIREAETALGLTFPDGLREMLECHNGQHFYSIDRDYGDPIVPMMSQAATRQYSSHYWLCGTQEIVDQTRFYREEYHEYYRDMPFETFGPARYHDQLIVFTASENADCLVLDLLPEPGGTIGQVVVYCTQPFQIAVISDSLGTFLRSLVRDFQAGRFKFSSAEYFVSYCEE